MRSRPIVAAVLLALALVGCEAGGEAAERVASHSQPTPSLDAGRDPVGAEHSPAAQFTPPEVTDAPSQPVPGTGPAAVDDGPCGDGGISSSPAPGLPDGDAVAEATLSRADHKGCGNWIVTLKNLDVVWQADVIIYPDDVDNPVTIPALPASLRARSSGQAIGKLGTPASVVVWLTYDDFVPRWRVQYVMRADTLRPLAATRYSAIANDHLRLLYREDENTRAERIVAQVERLRELHATQRANATNQKRPPTPRLDYLRSRTGR